MNNQLSHYTSIEPDFFQELEGEVGVKITGKLANFLRTLEIVRPNRFMTSEMKWCGIGRKKLDREKFFRAFLLKAEFNLPTTKVLIESLRTNTSWRLLCGWEYSSRIPSEATFSRAKYRCILRKIICLPSTKLTSRTIAVNTRSKGSYLQVAV